MPRITTVPAIRTAMTTMRSTLRVRTILDSIPTIPVHQAEHRGYKEQSSNRRKRQTADHGAAQRRVLLAAFTQTERHGHHADDHREGGHQHRAKTDKARV